MFLTHVSLTPQLGPSDCRKSVPAACRSGCTVLSPITFTFSGFGGNGPLQLSALVAEPYRDGGQVKDLEGQD